MIHGGDSVEAETDAEQDERGLDGAGVRAGDAVEAVFVHLAG